VAGRREREDLRTGDDMVVIDSLLAWWMNNINNNMVLLRNMEESIRNPFQITVL
jgi:hypothetical protein